MAKMSLEMKKSGLEWRSILPCNVRVLSSLMRVFFNFQREIASCNIRLKSRPQREASCVWFNSGLLAILARASLGTSD